MRKARASSDEELCNVSSTVERHCCGNIEQARPGFHACALYGDNGFALTEIIDQIEMLATQIDKLEREIVIQARQDDEMRRLATIPGVGAIIAMAVKAFVPDPAGFKSARHFAGWIGVTPKAHSSGGKDRLGRISKMGNPVLRSLLTTGAASVLRHVQYRDRVWPWLKNMLGRPPSRLLRSHSPIRLPGWLGHC